ncbi:HNH endonuclease [Bacillus atrophaeus]|uniref:HNH endonuclease n=1 Tax=Bacillus atrophaeus TaxID=1452 RepID=UPI0038736585
MNLDLHRNDTIMVDGEELYPVPGYPYNYANLEGKGRVYSTITQRYLSGKPNKRFGYCYVGLKNEKGEIESVGVHRAIWSAYTGYHHKSLSKSKLEIHHLDNDKTNNSPLNIAPVSKKINHSCPITNSKKGKGIRLKKEEVIFIRKMWNIFKEDGVKFSDFCNMFAYDFKCCYSTIENLLKYKSFKNI